MMTCYNTKENEKVAMIKNWLGCEKLRFVQTLKKDDEKCK